MSELINSLKNFASSTANVCTSNAVNFNKSSTAHPIENARGVPPLFVMALERADSCSESGFNQWRDAMRMVARLPGGIPIEFRLRLWENLADRYLHQNRIEWGSIIAKCCFINPRDQEISDQIDKDLHRTGCVGFSGSKQAVLKQVLVGYARWNPSVGYCQGFNMIGAMLLQMTNGNERLTLKVLIFLIEGILPQDYFNSGLKGLAVDMAVFREILKNRKPTLHAHLSQLQKRDDSPPLTDVFTMHWFLTLFIHCLPTQSVLRIWDLVLLEGSEVLLRAALVLWAAIETRILCVSSADEFYSVMGVVTREMLEFGIIEPNALVKCIVSIEKFPFPNLSEMRLRHRASLTKETTHRSFFLAKKELNALKKSYTAIRHRQQGSNIIMKNFEIVGSTQQTFRTTPNSTKTKSKRQNFSNLKTNHKSGSDEKLKKSKQSQGPKTNSELCKNNNILTLPNQQVTMKWDKARKRSKKLKKRRSSASSYTSSSSSTELCDSCFDDDEDLSWNEGNSKNLQNDHESNIVEKSSKLETNFESSHHDKSFEETEAELLRLERKNSEQLPSEFDTNDSQHFLEELHKIDRVVGKSDEFYENLSQRICELQFQNLTILTNCNSGLGSTSTHLSPPNTLSLYISQSPLPSPISPILSYQEHVSGQNFLAPNVSMLSRPLSPLPGEKNEQGSINNDIFNFFPMEAQVKSRRCSKDEECGLKIPEAQDLVQNESKDGVEWEDEVEMKKSFEQKSEVSDEISDVIRENIRILEKLKFKSAYSDENEAYFVTGESSSSSSRISSPDNNPINLEDNSKDITSDKLNDSSQCQDSSDSELRVKEGSKPLAITKRAKFKTQRKRSSSRSGGGSPRETSSLDKNRKKIFNPFPTARKPRVVSTKFGLYK